MGRNDDTIHDTFLKCLPERQAAMLLNTTQLGKC